LSSGLAIAAVGLLLILLFFATIHIALRQHSRVRITETLRLKGREHLMERFVASQSKLQLCMAALRTSCSIALTLIVLRMLGLSILPDSLSTYVLSFVVALTLVLIFGVAVPSAWAKYRGEQLLALSMPLLMFLSMVFYPLVWVLSHFDSLVRRLAGVPPQDEDGAAARLERELLDAVSEGEKLGAVDEEEKEMIESVMDLRDTDVAEIMTPRTEIAAIETGACLSDIKDLIRRVGHSRIPIFDENIDRVVGTIYAKDLLHVEDTADFKATAVMRPALFIPESKNLRDLLHEFQSQKVHMAIVLDEYGGTAGLVTIEDILEELVGEIADEYDPDEPAAMIRIDEDTVDIDARMRVDELNERLDICIPENEDYDTIGGFVFSTMGRIPMAGEQCAHDLVEIKVIDAEPRRINRVRLHVLRNSKPEEHGE
jgi:CBS domain containing-hemolysin-like protein